jgi:hypothetical protein
LRVQPGERPPMEYRRHSAVQAALDPEAPARRPGGVLTVPDTDSRSVERDRPAGDEPGHPRSAGGSPVRWWRTAERLCMCGHEKEAHMHYRAGNDCSLCECQKLRLRRHRLH